MRAPIKLLVLACLLATLIAVGKSEIDFMGFVLRVFCVKQQFLARSPRPVAAIAAVVVVFIYANSRERRR